MFFRNFRIKNFKGIEETEIFLSDNSQRLIHTLIGLNESGKTTILEALSNFHSQSSIADPTETLLDNLDANLSDWVPKKYKSNFNETIVIAADLEFEDGDVSALAKNLNEEHEFKLNQEKMPPKITIQRVYPFKDSVPHCPQAQWDIVFFGVRGRQRNEREISGNSNRDIWLSAVRFIQGSLIPKISYFPTFLFEFPDRIFLDETSDETRSNAFYRTVVQDVLDSLGDGLNVESHIVKRLTKGQEDDGGNNVSIVTPQNYYQGGDTKEQIDNVLDKIGDKITREVFSVWNQIFSSRGNGGLNITVELGVLVSATLNSSQQIYLEFKVKDGRTTYSIPERSLGFQWFFLLFFVYALQRLSGRCGECPIPIR